MQLSKNSILSTNSALASTNPEADLNGIVASDGNSKEYWMELNSLKTMRKESKPAK